MTSTTPLIVALDFPTYEDAFLFGNQLDPNKVKLKIGLQLFTNCGPRMVHTFHEMGFGIFLDLKFHDIPNTKIKSVTALAA